MSTVDDSGFWFGYVPGVQERNPHLAKQANLTKLLGIPSLVGKNPSSNGFISWPEMAE